MYERKITSISSSYQLLQNYDLFMLTFYDNLKISPNTPRAVTCAPAPAP